MEADLVGLKSLRIFFSYSTKDKALVGELKAHLDSMGFEVFLAHEDLKPCVEWQDEIIKNLRRCDVFIPVLTKEFKKSEWTAQEVGMAVCDNKFIVSLQIEITPFGFINRYQSLKINANNLETTAKNILKAIINKSPFGEDMRSFVINSFISSNTFEEAKIRTKALMEFDDFSDEQVKRIYAYTMVNNQIYEAWGARDKLKSFFVQYKHALTKEELEKVIKLLSS